ncbi:MAG: MMPL family transporter [Oscillibacter sp.]|nr:MMPL family transporter [Oscillibacter sp.]
MIEKIARWLTRKPALVLTVAVLLMIPSALGYVATRVNYDILSYIPAELPASRGEKLLEDPFNMAATNMLIVEGMPAGYANDLVRDIKDVEGVSNVLWLSNLVGIQFPVEMIPAQFRDMFFSGNATMMLVQYDHPGASNETMTAIENVRKLCNEKCFLAGFSVVTKDTRDIMEGELPFFIGLAVLLALVSLSLCLESTVLPLVLMMSIGIAVVYNLGTNVLFGEISFITKAIAAVLQLGVTVDYSIFLYHRYVAERPNYADRRDAMAQAVVAAFRSLSGSSMTTIAGFLALCFMRMTLGRDLGIVMAKGVVLGVTTVILVLPSFLLLFDNWIEKHRHPVLIPDFNNVNVRILRHYRFLLAAMALMVLPSVYASSRAEVYYQIDASLPQDIASIVSNNKLKADFDMATSHFIVLRDDLTAAQMSDIEKRMETMPGITSVVSYHKMLGTGLPDFFIPSSVKEMLKQGGYQLMMVNSSYSTATDEIKKQMEDMRTVLQTYDPEAMITGEGALYQGLIDTSGPDIRLTNFLSVAAIFLIIALTFQSVSIPLVLVATIELAIQINQGIAYFTGTENFFLAPVIISSIQLGATVDYAILMTSRFQEELRAGKSRTEAIRIAADTSDASIITSALVLFSATLGVSFIATIDLIGTICIMLARGAVISAVISLFFLPALLYVCEPLFQVTSLHWRTPPEPESADVPVLPAAEEK